MVRALVLLSVVLCLLDRHASRAHAEAGALLPPIAEASVPDHDRIVAQQAVVAYFAQFPDAIPITAPDEGVSRAGPEFRSCGDASCARDYAVKLEVDFAVAIRLFAPDRRGGTGSLSTALVTTDGVAYSSNVEIGDAGVHAATLRAVELAHERLTRGPGPWLKVDGPDGSRVRVDGRAPQAVPYTERHEPGLHRILVESDAGSLLFDGSVNLPDDPAHYEQVKVENRATDVASAATPAPEAPSGPPSQAPYWDGKRSKWNYIVGVPLTIAGLIYTAVGAVQYAARDNCIDYRDDRCWEWKTINGQSKAALGLGIASAAIGAGGFLFAGIIRDRTEAPAGAMLQLGGRF